MLACCHLPRSICLLDSSVVFVVHPRGRAFISKMGSIGNKCNEAKRKYGGPREIPQWQAQQQKEPAAVRWIHEVSGSHVTYARKDRSNASDEDWRDVPRRL